jgi:hypothetical protein
MMVRPLGKAVVLVVVRVDNAELRNEDEEKRNSGELEVTKKQDLYPHWGWWSPNMRTTQQVVALSRRHIIHKTD